MDAIVFKTPFYGVRALPRPRATIHDLPNELLAKIFILCYLIYKEKHPDYDAKHPPALLTRVCTHWTLVALNTPPLWGTLKIDRYRLKHPSASQVARFFGRSGILNLLLHYDERVFNRMNVPDPVIPWSRITELRLVSDETERVSLLQVRNLLAHTPNLVWLEAKRMNGELDMPPCPPIQLPYLQHLTLMFSSGVPMRIDSHTKFSQVQTWDYLCWARSSPFFLSLVLPKLVYLSIYCLGQSPDPKLMQVLTDLQLRSGFRLETLRLTDIRLDFDFLYKFFSRVPELRCLSLVSRHQGTQNFYHVLRKLTFRHDREDNLLPKLQNIFISDLDNWETYDVLDDIVLSSLESRWWPNELCPYRQEDLGMLKSAVIIWEDTWYDDYLIPHSEARPRAQELHKKMQLSYPTLGLPYLGEEENPYP